VYFQHRQSSAAPNVPSALVGWMRSKMADLRTVSMIEAIFNTNTQCSSAAKKGRMVPAWQTDIAFDFGNHPLETEFERIG
jgi:hypothetical protein